MPSSVAKVERSVEGLWRATHSSTRIFIVLCFGIYKKEIDEDFSVAAPSPTRFLILISSELKIYGIAAFRRSIAACKSIFKRKEFKNFPFHPVTRQRLARLRNVSSNLEVR